MNEAISKLENGKEIEVIVFPPTIPQRPINKTIQLRTNVGSDFNITEVLTNNNKIQVVSYPSTITVSHNEDLVLRYTPDINDKKGISAKLTIKGYWIA